MGRTMMIRIDGVISDEMAHAFPEMMATTVGFGVVEIVTIPE